MLAGVRLPDGHRIRTRVLPQHENAEESNRKCNSIGTEHVSDKCYHLLLKKSQGGYDSNSESVKLMIPIDNKAMVGFILPTDDHSSQGLHLSHQAEGLKGLT